MKDSKHDGKVASGTSHHGPPGNSTSRGPSSGPNASNLARIRENQRRSRARRKEYLQELEEKFRKCEQAGVEASHEMQQAAKRVLEENRQLRSFLRSRGVEEHEIDKCSASESIEAAQVSQEANQRRPSATKDLETLLSQRRPCPVESTPDDDATEIRRPSGSISTASSVASPAGMTLASSVSSTLPSTPHSHSSTFCGPVTTSADSGLGGTLAQGFDLSGVESQAESPQQYIQTATSMLSSPVDVANDSAFAARIYAHLVEPQTTASRLTMQQQQQQQQQHQLPQLQLQEQQQQQQMLSCSWPRDINEVPYLLRQDMTDPRSACRGSSFLDGSSATGSYF